MDIGIYITAPHIGSGPCKQAATPVICASNKTLSS